VRRRLVLNQVEQLDRARPRGPEAYTSASAGGAGAPARADSDRLGEVGRGRTVSRVLFLRIQRCHFEYRTTSTDTQRHDAAAY